MLHLGSKEILSFSLAVVWMPLFAFATWGSPETGSSQDSWSHSSEQTNESWGRGITAFGSLILAMTSCHFLPYWFIDSNLYIHLPSRWENYTRAWIPAGGNLGISHIKNCPLTPPQAIWWEDCFKWIWIHPSLELGENQTAFPDLWVEVTINNVCTAKWTSIDLNTELDEVDSCCGSQVPVQRIWCWHAWAFEA